MNRDQEQQLARRTLEQYTAGATTLGASQSTSPVSRYTDADRFALEMEKIHRRMPVPYVCSSELAEPNAFRRVSTSVGDVLFTRDEDGAAHAFFNVCRHRGSELVAEESGCSRRLVCPYHAWSYSSSGKLLSIPRREECFPELDPAGITLKHIPCVEAHGLIWLCAAAENEAAAHEMVQQHLGDIAADLDWLQLDQLQVFQRHARDWRANWKLLSEGGLETYHFKTAHRKTIGPFFPNDVGVRDSLGMHSRMVMPSEKAAEAANLPEGELRLRDFTHTLIGIAPQASFLAQERHVDWIRMTPLAVDRTEIIITSLVPAGEGGLSVEEQRHWDTNMQITLTTLDEDFLIGESIQRGLASGANTELHFGRNEALLNSFNAWVDRCLAE